MENLIRKLSSFNPTERKDALNQLISKIPDYQAGGMNVNMHFHSFNSYNCEAWSPCRIAYESKIRGLYAAGIIDFDVIDGRDEFLEASELLGLRASVGIETRAFHTEYEHLEIDSPGEPGVSYIAGSGFVTPLEEGSQQALTLAGYRKKAQERNLALVNRINHHLPEIAIDYFADVLPLTPGGNATERHIILAYIKTNAARYTELKALTTVWSNILGKPKEEVEALLHNTSLLEDVVRVRLAKKGGVGYVQPTSDSFPKVEEFFSWAQSCGAIPLESWLDGTSPGESKVEALLELSKEKGARGLNIIPDRNWNIKDPNVKALKYNKLKEIVDVAGRMNFPLHIGTEMNKPGLPFADDLEGEDLKRFKKQFLEGAQIFIGHAILLRFAGLTYAGTEADELFNGRVNDKNDFFASVGALPPINRYIADKLRNAGTDKSFTLIKDALKKGTW